MGEMIYPIIGRAEELPYFVGGMGLECWQDRVERPEGFWAHQLIVFSNGEGRLITEGREHRLSPGTAVFLPKLTPHCYYGKNYGWLASWVIFDGGGVDVLLDTLGILSCAIIEPDSENSADRLMRIMRKMFNVLKEDSLYGGFYASSGLYELLIEFHRLLKKFPSGLYGENTRFAGLISYIDNHCAEKIGMDTLIAVSELSETHICRLFRKYFGMRPMEYMNRKRIQRAKELLESSALSVEEISRNCGFEYLSYFGKLFRRYEGLSPSEYRALSKSESLPEQPNKVP